MASNKFNFEPAAGSGAGEEDEEKSSSLSKTIGNVMNLLNDGLYRIKNRTKSE